MSTVRRMVALVNIMGAWQRPTERNLAVTLRWRLTLAFVLVVLVPLLVGAGLVLKALPGAVQQQQAWGLASNARLTAQILQGYCDRARSTAEAAGRAASTVDADLEVHSLRSYFIRRGDHTEPIRFEVDRIRNGVKLPTYEYHYEGHRIRGATALMVRLLLDKLR